MPMDSTGKYAFRCRPIGISILIIIFAWLFCQNLISILQFKNSPTQFFFAEIELDFVAFLMSLLTLCINGVSIYCLFKPTPIGFWSILYGITVSSIIVSIQFVIMLTHLDWVKAAYTMSQRIRELPAVNPRYFSGMSITLMYVISISLSCLALGLIVIHRRYFFSFETWRIAKTQPDRN